MQIHADPVPVPKEWPLTCGDILCSDVDLAAWRGVGGPVSALLPVHQLDLHPLQRGAHPTYTKNSRL
jgi:hypothetical protein